MVKVVNNYVPPPKQPVVLPDPDAPYDINFRFPVRVLESDRIKLTPLIPSIHGKVLSEAIRLHPELLRYLPWAPALLVNDYDTHYESIMRSDPAWCVYAILDKAKLTDETDKTQGKEQTQSCDVLSLLSPTVCLCSADPPRTAIVVEHALAGAMGYLRADPELGSVEIGYAIVLPAYQRTFVSTHAIGLLLRYALDSPADGGLGLRRAQWQAHADNAASIRAAERMGMKLEGIMRWQRPWSADKEGVHLARDGDALGPEGGRHSAMLAMCWDDWEDSGREHVRKMMDRTS
ncbi:hypothetical protein FRC07_008173 [Ceratobasidium sp. 392]|nr:hypothetical protein FRC07_008173 [Ceratobasidium sp. 392]